MQLRTDVLGRRVVAGLLDIVVLVGLFVLVAELFHKIRTGPGSISISLQGLPAAVFIAAALTYYFVMELLFGRTIGKLLTGLRAVRLDGGRLTLRAALLRTVGRIIDILPALYLIGFISALASGSRQRIGDRIAGTTVSGR